MEIHDLAGTTYDGFYVEVHHNEDATSFYLHHKKDEKTRMYMFAVNPTNDEAEIRYLIENNIDVALEDYLSGCNLEEIT